MKIYRALRLVVRALFMLAFGFAAPRLACGEACEINRNQVGAVRIGMSRTEVLRLLSARYAVADVASRGATRRVEARPRQAQSSRPIVIVEFDRDRAFLIDSYERCATKDGVGPGLRLGEFQRRYGRGNLDPTDLGYFISFARQPGLTFLIDNQDVPKPLRGLLDDAITAGEESQILSLSRATIVAVRVEGR